ncbi:hypothetical protein D9757_002455 [Collybiopsis confluens]|uniref:Uncharacterized protein n=1 Tax=Collybiopsis confluens TaxID=2823264 RepID=A0A8H5HXS8_9AGAR|nr:hypothetical protein D9757_002455 [Collybiopsis confluens]
MATSIPSSAPLAHTLAHKIKRKPPPTLLDPISPVTPLRTPKVRSVESPPTAPRDDAVRSSNIQKNSVKSSLSSSTSSPAAHSLVPSTSPFTDPRYPDPDPHDPFAPLNVLRDRSRRSSSNALFAPSAFAFAAGSESTGRYHTTNAGGGAIQAVPSTSSCIPAKAARTLGVTKISPNFPDAHAERKNTRKRTSVASFQLYPDPPSSAIRVYDADDEIFRAIDTPRKSSTSTRPSRAPKSKISEPTTTSSRPAGHYTVHSRQRAQSSFSSLSSPSPPERLQLHIPPPPESFPPPSLVRYRSESSASGTSSNGTGNHSHSGSASDSTLFTPDSAVAPLSVLGSKSTDGAQIEVADPYAITMSLLSQSGGRDRAQSPSRSSSPSRIAHAKTASREMTPKAGKIKEMEVERPMSPASSMLRLARFFTSKSSKSSESSPPPPARSEKSKLDPSSFKISPSRGRGRTRKLSTSSINISTPITPPVLIPMGQDFRGAITEHPGLKTRSMTRQRSQTTSGLLTMATPSVSNRLIVPLSNVTRQTSSTRVGEQEVEEEIEKDLNMSRLKPWTASIPRKRSSLSLSILPGQQDLDAFGRHSNRARENVDSASMLHKVDTEDFEGSLTTCETRGKCSRESAVSAGSMGSSYINVLRSGEDMMIGDKEEEIVWPVRSPIRSKTNGEITTTKSSGIGGIRFPGFRRAHSSRGDLTSSSRSAMAAAGSTSGSVRGLRISSPFLQNPPAGPTMGPISSPATSLTPPILQQSTEGHGRAISDSIHDRGPVRSASPFEDVITSSIRLPSTSELEALVCLPLFDENGQKIAFGDALSIPGVENGKTVIVIFLRHFWCPLDQDYVQEMGDLLRHLSEDVGGWNLATEAGELRIGKGKDQKKLPDVVMISNGSPALISKYKQIFDLDGEKLNVWMYTDPTCAVYGVLGMEDMKEACVSENSISPPSRTQSPVPSNVTDSSRLGESGPSLQYEAGVPLVRIDHRTPPKQNPNRAHRKAKSLALSASLLPSSRSRSPSPANRLPTEAAPMSRSISPASSSGTRDQRTYVKHASVIGGIASVVMRAVKVGLPVWEKGGAIRQLGGEVVFRVAKDDKTSNPALQVECLYAHRMQNTRDHTSFSDVLKIALTASPSTNSITFRTSFLDWRTQHDIESEIYSTKSTPLHERSLSTPPGAFASTQRTTNSAPCSPNMASRFYHTPASARISGVRPSPDNDSDLDSSNDITTSSWGDQLYTLHSRTSKDVSESIRGLRGTDSVRSSTGSSTPNSVRAVRAARVPRGPRMRMQSVSAESLAGSPSPSPINVRSFSPGIGGIESVLECGESISSPDLPLVGQWSVHRRRSYWRRSNSTPTSSVYFDADEGAVDMMGVDTADDMDGEESIAMDVLPVHSRPASRMLNAFNSPEIQDQSLDSIKSEYSTASAPDRSDVLTSVCSEPVDDGEEAENLKDLLLERVSGSMRGRGLLR